jgi:hypothetical protein
LAVVFILVFVLAQAIVLGGYFGSDLDSGYVLALLDRLAAGARFGRDVFFTSYGPLVPLYVGIYHPALSDWAWPVRSLLDLVLAGGLMLAVAPVPLALAVICTVLAMAAADGDGLSFAFGILPVLLWVRRDSIWCRRWLFVAPLLAAIALLEKTTLGSIAIVTLVLMDCGRVLERRLPVFVPGFLVVLPAVWLAVGQSMSDLIPFCRGAFGLASNFSQAMQLVGPVSEVAVFASVTICVLAVAFPSGSSSARRARVAWCGLVVLAFVAMKAGFVRQDQGHLATAWSVAALLPLLALPLAADNFRRAALTLLPLLGLGAGLYSTNPREPLQELVSRVERDWVKPVVWNPQYIGDFARDPAAFRASVEAVRADSLAEIRRVDPLPYADGTVEVMEVRQASLLAHGMNYRPRPSLQGYPAGSENSLVRNREFFEGPDAPDHVLFGLDQLDGRYPSLTDGASWPTLFARYQETGADHGVVVLTRRSEPRSTSEETLGVAQLELGDFVTVPHSSDHVVWVKIGIEPSWFGRLLAVLWRMPVVEIQVEYVDGRNARFRLVPDMAAAGFLLSPSVATGAEAVDLMEGRTAPDELMAVRRFALVGSNAAFAYRYPIYRHPIPVRFYSLLIDHE